MIGQHRRLSEPLRWTRASRLAVIIAGLALAAAVAAVIAVALVNARPQRAGCIEVTFPSTLGAAVMHACGARARATCADPAQNPGIAVHGLLRDACRQEGLPYGTASQAR
jgi:hypothetical protein